MNSRNTSIAPSRGGIVLEDRLAQFHNQYLAAISDEQDKFALDGKGKSQLGFILSETSYLKDGDAPVYRRLSMDFQSREPVIDILEFRDVLANKENGFSYIRLSNLEELDAYTQARNARLEGNFYASLTFGSVMGGMLLGTVMDIGGAIIASNTNWDLNALWLFAPLSGGAVLGAIVGGVLEVSGSNKSKEATAFFQKQYQHRITTGPEAILKALNVPYAQALPGGQ